MSPRLWLISRCAKKTSWWCCISGVRWTRRCLHSCFLLGLIQSRWWLHLLAVAQLLIRPSEENFSKVIYLCLLSVGLGWPYRNATESYWDIDLIPLPSCEIITFIWMLQQTPKYFSMFKMEPFHLIISAIFSPVCVLLSPQNWTNLELALISWLGFVVIAHTYGGRWLIDSSDSAARI